MYCYPWCLVIDSRCSERKRQREREENWKTLQRKVSGTSAVTITTSADNEFYNFSFPPRPNFDDDEDEDEEEEEEEEDDAYEDHNQQAQDFDIMTDEETDAELDHSSSQQHEEHHDVIHPDMVSTQMIVWQPKLIDPASSNSLTRGPSNNSNNLDVNLLYPSMKL